MAGKYVYLTCCVDSTAAWITPMVDAAVDVTYDTFLKRCDLSGCPAVEDYETDRRRGLTLKADWMVHYAKSSYRGVPCYYLNHSMIEYIFVSPADAKKLREEDRAKAAESVPAGRDGESRMERLRRSWLPADWGVARQGQPG